MTPAKVMFPLLCHRYLTCLRSMCRVLRVLYVIPSSGGCDLPLAPGLLLTASLTKVYCFLHASLSCQTLKPLSSSALILVVKVSCLLGSCPSRSKMRTDLDIPHTDGQSLGPSIVSTRSSATKPSMEAWSCLTRSDQQEIQAVCAHTAVKGVLVTTD